MVWGDRRVATAYKLEDIACTLPTFGNGKYPEAGDAESLPVYPVRVHERIVHVLFEKPFESHCGAVGFKKVGGVLPAFRPALVSQDKKGVGVHIHAPALMLPHCFEVSVFSLKGAERNGGVFAHCHGKRSAKACHHECVIDIEVREVSAFLGPVNGGRERELPLAQKLSSFLVKGIDELTSSFCPHSSEIPMMEKLSKAPLQVCPNSLRLLGKDVRRGSGQVGREKLNKKGKGKKTIIPNRLNDLKVPLLQLEWWFLVSMAPKLW